jgi:tetratricopeptide (TPR) repeat protein
MFSRRQTAFGADLKRKRLVRNVFFGAVALGILSLLLLLYNKSQGKGGIEQKQLRNSFESGVFEDVYSQSSELLKQDTMDSFLLSMRGFSAYQLAIAQINNFDTLFYVDECIWSLRKALLLKENSNDGRIFYVLGKAYYYKGPSYADLAVNYLEKAQALYKSADIPEYLGLAYASLNDYRSSVAAFSQALYRPSDVLLLSIAKSYLALEEELKAKAYLLQCLEISMDSKTSAAARLLLGNTLVKEGNLDGAEEEYLLAIEENDENAEAHFRLGELYALRGDATGARAEWRRTLRIDPTHAPARNRLN